jgi:hypothetical protein
MLVTACASDGSAGASLAAFTPAPQGKAASRRPKGGQAKGRPKLPAWRPHEVPKPDTSIMACSQWSQ